MLAYAWRYTHKPEYLNAARKLLLTGAEQDEPVGNPLDDRRWGDAMVGYQQIRQDIPEAERRVIDRWMSWYISSMIDWQYRNNRPGDNSFAWQLATIGLAALATDDNSHIHWVIDETRQFLERNLNSDGSTSDFRQRDSIGYHLFDLKALLTLANALQTAGFNLYGYRTSRDGSRGKSLQFVLPYADGQENHREFVNSSYGGDKLIHRDEVGRPWVLSSAATAFLSADAFEARWGDLDRAADNGNPYPHENLTYLLDQATREVAQLAPVLE